MKNITVVFFGLLKYPSIYEYQSSLTDLGYTIIETPNAKSSLEAGLRSTYLKIIMNAKIPKGELLIPSQYNELTENGNSRYILERLRFKNSPNAKTPIDIWFDEGYFARLVKTDDKINVYNNPPSIKTFINQINKLKKNG